MPTLFYLFIFSLCEHGTLSCSVSQHIILEAPHWCPEPSVANSHQNRHQLGYLSRKLFTQCSFNEAELIWREEEGREAISTEGNGLYVLFSFSFSSHASSPTKLVMAGPLRASGITNATWLKPNFKYSSSISRGNNLGKKLSPSSRERERDGVGERRKREKKICTRNVARAFVCVCVLKRVREGVGLMPDLYPSNTWYYQQVQ